MKSLILLYDNKKETASDHATSFSLFLVCYNQKELIKQSISSVISQLTKGDEIVVIDDCSNDGCAAVAENYLRTVQAPCRVRLFTKEANKGVNHSFNTIPSVAIHSNILVLAGDDFYYPNAINYTRSIIDSSPNYSALYSSCKVVDMSGNVIGYSNYPKGFLPYSIKQLTATGSSNVQGHSLVCLNKKTLSLYSRLKENVSNEDDQLILRCTILGGICISHTPIKAYRKANGSMSSPHVNFKQPVDCYMRGLIEPLRNRIANYKLNAEFLEDHNSAEGVSRLDINALISNYNSCIECLSTTVRLVEQRDVLSRVNILLKYLLRYGFCKSIYYKQNFIIALSHRLFFYLKKKRYFSRFSA